MIYERPSSDYRPSSPRPPYQPQYAPQRPPDETLAEDKLVLEYKTFLLSLRENSRGRVLRISEAANGRFNTIMVPASGLDDFKQIVDALVKASAEMP